MIYFDKILTSLSGVVGWRQSTTTGATVVDAANIESSSGLFVQGANNLVSVKNIVACHEDKAMSAEEINNVLRDILKDGISNVLNNVFTSHDVFKSAQLYRHEMDFLNPVELNRTGFAGFEINTSKRSDISTIINKLILSFSDSGSIKILLFNSGTKTLINSKTVTITANGNDESIVDWVLGKVIEPDSTYYIGYLLNSSTVAGYNREYNESDEKTKFNECGFRPIWVDGWNSETLFDVNNIEYVTETWGLNFDVSTVRDYSQLILSNKNRFAKAIQLAAAVEAISFMNSTSRVNPEERVVMNVLGKKTVVDSPAIYNLYSSLEKEIKSLRDLFFLNKNETLTLR
jgi:hypothetical protein